MKKDKKILESKMNEEQYQKLYQENINNTKTNTKYIINNGSLFKQDKNDRVRKIIKRWELDPLLYMLHDHPMSAHFGVERTVTKAKEKYYWPKMRKDIEIYIKSCDQC